MTDTYRLDQVAHLNPRPATRPTPGTRISFLAMADVGSDGSTKPGSERNFDEVAKGFTHFRRDDILVAKITPCFENGKIAQARTEHELAAGSTEFHVVRADPGVLHGRYLHHYLRQPFIRKEGERRMTGSGGQRRLPHSYLSNLRMYVPSFREQRRIAEMLDKVDSLRVKRQQAITLLDDLARSTFFDMFGDPASNSRDLAKVRLRDLAFLATGSTPSRKLDDNYGGEIPWVKTGEVRGGVISSTEESLSETGAQNARCKIHPKGSIVIALYGQGRTRGQAGVLGMPAATNQACAVVYPNDRYDTSFIFQQLKISYEQLRAMARGGNQANLNMKLIGDFDVMCPDINSQRLFAKKLDEINDLKSHHLRQVEQLDELFASLQSKAFRGEL
ncbi:restriction endonuclease subunit S [Actinomadura flavalba]|uniref:restriction endonuclease subunit S n=1 Tax=Actinomadura flavalba TaxID=1120938 RepID=UPI00039D718E|nr:restriction endonuclease subunit S [Actinomadura flavalba]